MYDNMIIILLHVVSRVICTSPLFYGKCAKTRGYLKLVCAEGALDQEELRETVVKILFYFYFTIYLMFYELFLYHR